MAHKKAGGSTSLGRDSQSQRLGTKLFDGQFAKTGAILVRQRGSKIRAGKHVGRGVDDTLFALTAGIVKFGRKKIKKYTGSLEWARYVNVVPKK